MTSPAFAGVGWSPCCSAGRASAAGSTNCSSGHAGATAACSCWRRARDRQERPARLRARARHRVQGGRDDGLEAKPRSRSRAWRTCSGRCSAPDDDSRSAGGRSQECTRTRSAHRRRPLRGRRRGAPPDRWRPLTESPLLVVVDDAHWLDAASAETIRFAVRRLSATGWPFSVAVRDHEPSVFDGAGFPELRSTGSTAGGRRAACATPANRWRSRVAISLVDATAGNPLALLRAAGFAERRSARGRGGATGSAARRHRAFVARSR